MRLHPRLRWLLNDLLALLGFHEDLFSIQILTLNELHEAVYADGD